MSYIAYMASQESLDRDERVGRQAQQRSRTLPPPMPLGLPEGRSTSPSGPRQQRSRSPLRQSFIEGGSSSKSEDDHFTDAASTARESVTKIATDFLRVGSSFIGGNNDDQPSPASRRKPPPSSPGSVLSRLTDAELEAEATRERERSRMEAERILTLEAEHRRREEEKIYSSLTRSSDRDSYSLQTPIKETGGFFAGVMKKLTPTKESVSPAQQIINETKARERAVKSSSNGERMSYLSLDMSRPGQPPSLTTPTGSPGSRLAPSNYSPSGPITPSPQRTHGPPGGSPVLAPQAGEPAPLYAVFNPQGSLDVPATLVTVARRFEKLEKWTVSHVRALEERMKDVEKYLIDKEAEFKDVRTDAALRKDLNAMKFDLGNVQAMLKDLQEEFSHSHSIVAPVQANGTGARGIPQTRALPTKTTSQIESTVRHVEPAARATPQPQSSSRPVSIVQPTTSVFSTRSAPIAAPLTQTLTGSPSINGTPPLTSKPSRSRLPYPSGDYTSSSSQPGSPDPGSPPFMVNSFTGGHGSASGSESSYVIPKSPTPPPSNLGPPRTPVGNNRAASTSPSPTPRKRYTIALSGRDDVPSPNGATRGEGEVQTALFSDHGRETSDATAVPDREDTQSPDPIVGGTPVMLSRLSTSPPPGNGRPWSMYAASPSLRSVNSNTMVTQTSPRTPSFRARAQSTFSSPNNDGSPTGGKPPHKRAQSQSVGLGLGLEKDKEQHSPPRNANRNTMIFNSQGKPFVDPLVIRKKSKTSINGEPMSAPALKSPPGTKIPFGQLVAFFDGGEKQ